MTSHDAVTLRRREPHGQEGGPGDAPLTFNIGYGGGRMEHRIPSPLQGSIRAPDLGSHGFAVGYVRPTPSGWGAVCGTDRSKPRAHPLPLAVSVFPSCNQSSPLQNPCAPRRGALFVEPGVQKIARAPSGRGRPAEADLEPGRLHGKVSFNVKVPGGSRITDNGSLIIEAHAHRPLAPDEPSAIRTPHSAMSPLRLAIGFPIS